MKFPNLSFALSLLLAFFPLSAVSQGLPAVKTAEEVKSGTFPNGVSYYIVANNSSKGYANFALVQKGRSNQDRIRENLNTLPNFSKMPPYMFEASKGVGYKKEGYVKYPGNSSVFSFEDVPCFDSAALDSTIILIFDIVREFEGDQALIVSGDVDASRIKDRFYLLSLTVGPRGERAVLPEYKWEPSDKIRVVHNPSTTRRLSSITVSYASARLPKEYMGTAQPLVLSMFASELGSILKKRTELAFANAGIPLADMEFNYKDSSMGDGDESYSFTIYVDECDLNSATATFAGILSDLDEKGASAVEFANAKAEFLSEADKLSDSEFSNKEYVDACVASFLHGAAIMSRSAAHDFFRGRKLSLDRDLAMFNRFVSALLDARNNLSIEVGTPSANLDKDGLVASFTEAWKGDSSLSYQNLHLGDTLSLAYAGKKKVKLRAEIPDPVTGGELWTFSNGMKVLFRKTDDSRVNYCWMLRGGYSEVPGIGAGESAFVGDMLDLYKVAGLEPTDFHKLLEMNGVSMQCKVNLTDMRIQGSTIPGKVELLLRSLLSLVHNRELSPEAFEYYRKCEGLRQEAARVSEEGIYAVMDSVMCPDFYYPLTKNMDKLSPNLPEKVDKYFSAQFRKSSDGVLYIDGNLDKDSLQKLLCQYLGTFYTSNKFSIRPKVPYQLRSGWSTYTVDRELSYVGDGSSSTSMAVAVQRPFSMKTWCTFRIAMEAFRRQLVAEMAPLGQFVETETQLQLFPTERLAVFVNVRPCDMEGLPLEVEPADPYTTLGAIRDALTYVSIHGVSESDLKGIKASLAHEMEAELSDPVYLMNAYLRRISEGKDMVTNHKGYLSSVSVADVTELLKNFEDAGKVEYIIK